MSFWETKVALKEVHTETKHVKNVSLPAHNFLITDSFISSEESEHFEKQIIACYLRRGKHFCLGKNTVDASFLGVYHRFVFTLQKITNRHSSGAQ